MLAVVFCGSFRRKHLSNAGLEDKRRMPGQEFPAWPWVLHYVRYRDRPSGLWARDGHGIKGFTHDVLPSGCMDGNK